MKKTRPKKAMTRKRRRKLTTLEIEEGKLAAHLVRWVKRQRRQTKTPEPLHLRD